MSRMQGDLHVRFLGGGGAEMRHRYPTLAPTPTRDWCTACTRRRRTKAILLTPITCCMARKAKCILMRVTQVWSAGMRSNKPKSKGRSALT